jgi:hypothetical protein
MHMCFSVLMSLTFSTSILFNTSVNIQMSSIESIIDSYSDIISPVPSAKSTFIPPRDVQMTQRVARLLSWRLNTILSSATSMFGKLSYRVIKRLSKPLSLIASQSNQALDRANHELCTLCDSMSGDFANAMASILPRSVLIHLLFFLLFCFIILFIKSDTRTVLLSPILQLSPANGSFLFTNSSKQTYVHCATFLKKSQLPARKRLL